MIVADQLLVEDHRSRRVVVEDDHVAGDVVQQSVVGSVGNAAFVVPGLFQIHVGHVVEIDQIPLGDGRRQGLDPGGGDIVVPGTGRDLLLDHVGHVGDVFRFDGDVQRLLHVGVPLEDGVIDRLAGEPVGPDVPAQPVRPVSGGEGMLHDRDGRARVIEILGKIGQELFLLLFRNGGRGVGGFLIFSRSGLVRVLRGLGTGGDRGKQYEEDEDKEENGLEPVSLFHIEPS